MCEKCLHVDLLIRIVSFAGRPAQLQNCTIQNQTFNSLQVDCMEGFDGGLPQSFFMEILELPTLRPRLNLTTYRMPPTFIANGLDAGTSYRIVLYAVNAKGRSDPTVIDPVTFKGVAKLQGNFQKNYARERGKRFAIVGPKTTNLHTIYNVVKIAEWRAYCELRRI